MSPIRSSRVRNTGYLHVRVLAVLVAALVVDAAPPTSASSVSASANPFNSLRARFRGGARAEFSRATAAATDTAKSVRRTDTHVDKIDLAASAAVLGLTEREFRARGLEPEVPPHNITHERRERRELSEMDTWMDARATWYGGKDGPGPDGMSIYTGSCGFGQDLGNHFVSAWQTDGGYDWGLTDKCGQCFEVMCIDGHTRGLDWSELGPWGGCVEPGVKSVTVKISDSCPCHHPNSGNKRWCCGDRVHLDLSYVAFDSIAMRHRGVVDLKVRPADCAKQGVVAFYQ